MTSPEPRVGPETAREYVDKLLSAALKPEAAEPEAERLVDTAADLGHDYDEYQAWARTRGGAMTHQCPRPGMRGRGRLFHADVPRVLDTRSPSRSARPSGAHGGAVAWCGLPPAHRAAMAAAIAAVSRA